MSKQYDLIGKQFGKLTVVKKIGSVQLSNGKTNIIWGCHCLCGGYIETSTANLNNRHTNQCDQCAHQSSGLKRRQDLTGQKYGLLTVTKMLYNYNETNRTKCLCDCDCGAKDVIKDAYNIKTGKIKSCGCIKGLSQREMLIGQSFGKLIVVDEIFDNVKNPMVKCDCACGSTGVLLSRKDVMSGHTQSCGCLKRDILNTINDIDQSGYISDYGVEIMDKYGKNDKGQTLWNCKCGFCGSIFQELPARIKNNHVRSCGCLNQSSREYYIESILKSLNVNYIPQYVFQNCKSNRGYVLRFDFAVFTKQNNLLFLIEYDGEQHSKPIDIFGGEEGYKDCLIRDQIKNEYCKTNNIVLLRIPFTYSEQEINEVIYNTLESVTTTV